MSASAGSAQATAARRQLERVLAALPRLERRSPALRTGRGPTPMEVSERQAVNPAAAASASLIPDEGAGRVDRQTAGIVISQCAADLVRLNKFSTPSHVRATAFYWSEERPLAVHVSIGPLPRRPLTKAALSVRQAIGTVDLLRAPEVMDQGRTVRVSFMVEELVFGAHPRTPEEKRTTGVEVIERLFAACAQTELRFRGEKPHPATQDRLRRLIEQVPSVEESVVGDELLAGAARLVDVRVPLPTGPSHGDVVFSNLIRDESGLVYLIDWENANVRPVIADLGKLAAAIPGDEGLRRVLDLSPGSALEDPRSGLSGAEQLSRFYLQELSWWEPKLRRAQQTGRMATFDSWVNRRTQILARLLAG